MPEPGTKQEQHFLGFAAGSRNSAKGIQGPQVGGSGSTGLRSSLTFNLGAVIDFRCGIRLRDQRLPLLPSLAKAATAGASAQAASQPAAAATQRI